MRVIDVRDPAAMVGVGPDEGRCDDDRYSLILAADSSIKFRLDSGNLFPWSQLGPKLKARLPGNGHEQLHDVSVGIADAEIDARCGDDGVRWICEQLVARNLLPPSAPVTLLHVSGQAEPLGALGEVLRQRAAPSFH
jgi:hypothetical protein